MKLKTKLMRDNIMIIHKTIKDYIKQKEENAENWRYKDMNISIDFRVNNGSNFIPNNFNNVFNILLDICKKNNISEDLSVNMNMLNPIFIKINGYVFYENFVKDVSNKNWGDVKGFITDIVNKFDIEDVVINIDYEHIEVNKNLEIGSIIVE